jgi:hypothetical protein
MFKLVAEQLATDRMLRKEIVARLLLVQDTLGMADWISELQEQTRR